MRAASVGRRGPASTTIRHAASGWAALRKANPTGALRIQRIVDSRGPARLYFAMSSGCAWAARCPNASATSDFRWSCARMTPVFGPSDGRHRRLATHQPEWAPGRPTDAPGWQDPAAPGAVFDTGSNLREPTDLQRHYRGQRRGSMLRTASNTALDAGMPQRQRLHPRVEGRGEGHDAWRSACRPGSPASRHARSQGRRARSDACKPAGPRQRPVSQEPGAALAFRRRSELCPGLVRRVVTAGFAGRCLRLGPQAVGAR